VIQSKADGAINFTASHNPPEYNGIKFSTPDGAPALPEATQGHRARDCSLRCESEVPRTAGAKPSPSPSIRAACIFRACAKLSISMSSRSRVKIAFDPMWGAARGYSDAFLREAGVTVATVHDTRDVLFGGHAPEPDDHLLEDLRHKMREIGAGIGIATDGDADRFGIVDEDGTFLQPNYVIALLFDYLVESRGWKKRSGQVGRDHEPHQRACRKAQNRALRDAGWL
jgi:phosphoglucomutase